MKLRPLGDPTYTFVIAEIAGNHSRDLNKAITCIESAAQAGADAVKFQTFTAGEIAAEGIVIPRGHNLDHDAWLDSHGVKSMRQLFEKGGLPREWHQELKNVAGANGVEFISTPFSVDAAKFLVEEIGVRILKIASGDLTYTPLLEYAASTDCEIIISTAGAYLSEVGSVIHNELQPRFRGGDGPIYGVSVLQCVSQYPCPERDAGLDVIRTYKSVLPEGANVGYSDHTLDFLVPCIAVAMGATIIEKHFKLAHDKSSIDVEHSMDQYDFSEMVSYIRDIPFIVEPKIKQPLPAELHDRVWARRDPSDWLRPTRPGRLGYWEVG